MPKSTNDKHAPDAEDMFDFLADDSPGRTGPRPVSSGAADRGASGRGRSNERVMPIIRKPVPLDRQSEVRDAVASHKGVAKPSGGRSEPIRQPSGQPGASLDEFAFLDGRGRSSQPQSSRSDGLRSGVGFDDDWRTAHQGVSTDSTERESRPMLWLLAGIVLSLLGAGAYIAWPLLFGDDAGRSPTRAPADVGASVGTDTITDDRADTSPVGAGQDSAQQTSPDSTDGQTSGLPVDTPSPRTVSPMAQRFQSELAAITELVDAGEFEQADSALTQMDRSVYGYGAREFQVLEGRIREALDEQGVIAEREAEARRLEEAAQQAERDRLGELERQADAERQAEIASQAELERVANVEREAARAVEQARTAQVERDRAATERAQAEARALAERDRLAEAERLALAERRAAEVANAQQTTVSPSAAAQPITDDDLQTVYGQFVELKQAIEARDIATVARVTQPSGLRIQQFLQVFENSSEVRTRIVGVAARPSSNAISGTLRIDAIVRPDGTEVSPPNTLSLITLSSSRNDGGWSPISW